VPWSWAVRRLRFP